MPARRVVVKAGAARPPAVAAQQVRRHAALVQKHILPGIVQRQPVAPVPPLPRDVSAPLFIGVYGFFFPGKPAGSRRPQTLPNGTTVPGGRANPRPAAPAGRGQTTPGEPPP